MIRSSPKSSQSHPRWLSPDAFPQMSPSRWLPLDASSNFSSQMSPPRCFLPDAFSQITTKVSSYLERTAGSGSQRLDLMPGPTLSICEEMHGRRRKRAYLGFPRKGDAGVMFVSWLLIIANCVLNPKARTLHPMAFDGVRFPQMTR